MKFKKIVTVGIGESSLEAGYWEKLNTLGEKIVRLPKDSPETDKQLADADCLLVSLGIPVTGDIINCAPNLKYIGTFSTGYGRVDDQYAAQKGIAVCNIPGYSTEAVAEFAFGIILEHIRDLGRGKKQAKEGDYSESTFFHVYEIKSKKFGVIGLGKIGGRIAEIASGFGADVRYWSRTRKKELEAGGIKYQDVEKLLAECDFISLNLALNKETENFLNDKRIQKIKPGSLLINLAPNELIDIDALQKRLGKEDITYIFDHTDELSAEQAKQLSGYKNCIMYPPIAYTTKEATVSKQEIFVGNIENFLKGMPTNKVN
jgi:phosphoglycerate dehydrogenase-like enzyme